MKKLLTLVLVLALVFSVAGTAFAFTGISEQETSTDAKFSVKVELVDYNYGWKDGIYYNVPASRAYAINEAVGAVVTVVVPAKGEPTTLKLTQTNMKVLGIDSDKAAEDDGIVFTTPIDPSTNEEMLPENTDTTSKTYKFFVTAQLKSDKGGSITASVVDFDDEGELGNKDGIMVKGASGLEFNVVFDHNPEHGYYYGITAIDDGENFEAGNGLNVVVSKNYLCKELWLIFGMDYYKVATVNGKLAFQDSPSTYITSGDDEYSDLLAAYNELVDEFGFDFTAEGYLYKSFFTKLDGSVSVSHTAYVEPALPSSALLPGLSVTIPQTGSVSFAGFAMIALAVAAAVALKKAR